jgi:Restriction endonuclease NotI
MAGYIWEFFGYRATDSSPEALDAAINETCPFLESKCEKRLSDGLIAGACSISPMRSKAVICCPIRLYADDYRILQDISHDAFGSDYELVPGARAVEAARTTGERKVAVFGKKWGGELRVPKKDGLGGYWVDWILALLDEQGHLMEFVAVEVQSIDTTGNYRRGRSALKAGQREEIKTTAGFNWENVNKRILPQLIYKGQLLQREPYCKKGLYFVCPQQVYDEVTRRVGGIDALPEFRNLQPASISFYVYDHDLTADTPDGEIILLKQTAKRSTVIDALVRAFNSVTLTKENVYRDVILEGLGADRGSQVDDLFREQFDAQMEQIEGSS